MTQADTPTSTGTTQVVNRIKRAQGQLSGVLRMLEEGRDLQEIVNQLKAVSRALDRAGFAIIATELRESARKGAVTEEELDQLERFFLSLRLRAIAVPEWCTDMRLMPSGRVAPCGSKTWRELVPRSCRCSTRCPRCRR